MISWRDLACCDWKALQELLPDTPNPHRIDTVSDFGGDIRDHPLYSEILSSYSTALTFCRISPLLRPFSSDKFTSLGLFAKTDLAAGESLQITGHLAVFPENEIVQGVNDFSVYTGSVSRLMLGPLSFVNSSCFPNAQYRTNDKFHPTHVKLFVLRNISANEEITVNYSGQYFDKSTCECPYFTYHSEIIPTRTRSQTRSLNPRDVPVMINSIIANPPVSVEVAASFETSSVKTLVKTSSVKTPSCFYSGVRGKRQRIFFPKLPRSRERIRYQAVESDEDSSTDSESVPNPVAQNNTAIEAEVENLDISAAFGCSSGDIPEPPDVPSDFNPPRFSTPNLDYAVNEECEYFGDLGGDDDSCNLLSDLDDSDDDMLEKLYPNSDASTKNFVTAFNSISSIHTLSDACKKDFLRLFEITLPSGNACSSTSVSRQILSSECTSDQFTIHKLGESTFIQCNLTAQLHEVISRNLQSLKKYKEKRELTEQSVITDIVLPFSDFYHLIINSDGVPVYKSSKLSVWPIWAMIGELPPVLRKSFVNISLLGFWCGKNKQCLDWDCIWRKFIGEFWNLKDHGITIAGEVFLFKPYILIADMPAKASLLNIIQFNGYYGCPRCTMRGERICRRLIYPIFENFTLRTPEQFYLASINVGLAAGVKGHCVLQDVFANLPISAPIDIMHQGFLGVARALIMSLFARVPKQMRENLCVEIVRCFIPIATARQPRSLDELKYFKASEIQILTLYLAPVLLKKYLVNQNQPYYRNFCALVFLLKLLMLKRISEETLEAAETCLHYFNVGFAELYDIHCQSYNIHSLRHLVEQVRRFGPLTSTSAFAFENANRLLCLSLTGTVNTAELLATRYFNRKIAGTRELESDKLTKFTKCLAKNSTDSSIDCFMFTSPPPTSVSQMVQELFEAGGVSYKGRYYDSENYTLYHSLGYSRISGKRNHCAVRFVNLSGEHFGFIHMFFDKDDGHFAAIECCAFRPFNNFSFLPFELPPISMFVIADLPGSLVAVPVTDLREKCVVVESNDNCAHLAVIVETLDHN